MNAFEVNVSKHLPAPPEVVFDAWTTRESMEEWFSPMTTSDIPVMDVRVGGKYQIDMKGKDCVHSHTGEYKEIDRPNKLVFTWISDGTNHEESVVTVLFEAEGDGTLLTLRHEGLPSEKACDEHRGGWTAIADKLEARLAG